ncbi:protein O-mannosyl-transferase TMTC3-like isoform X4 [Convolutriloba macropyga]|uniref:protein O-mannosyl-transferase TMTC3-like isoform X4 n=1 Tax=Convolutriloba macropyga TaxID=536237 RepID=UPI003F5246AE
MQLFYPAICGCAALLVYTTSLNCGFVFDDSAAILKNYDLRQTHPWTELFRNDFWGTAMKSERSHKSYRPITVLTFRINYLLQELEPFGYHLVNALLHALASILLYLFLSSNLRYFDTQKPSSSTNLFDRKIAFITSLLFAVHPVHVEAVTGIVGRAEILSFIASLAVMYFCIVFANYASSTGKGTAPIYCSALCAYLATSTTLGLAMLCKETGVTTCAVCAIIDLYFICQKSLRDVWDELIPFIIWTDKNKEPPNLALATNKNQKKSLAVSGWLRRFVFRQLLLLTALVILVFLRIYLVQGGQMPSFTAFDNPAAMAKSPAREMTLNYLLPINIWLLLCPWWLCCDWSMGTIPLIQSPLDTRNLATAAFWCGILIAGRRCFAGRDKLTAQIAFALSLIVFPFLPASNLLFPVGFVVAERVLYTPSAGFCILVAMGMQRLVQIVKRFEQNSVTGISASSGKYLVYSCLLVTICAHFARTSYRNYDWKDEFSLFISAVKNNKFNAKCWNNVGHSLEQQQRFYEALSFFHQATIVQPDDVGAIINVARTLKNLNMASEAEKWFYHAIELLPTAESQKAHQQSAKRGVTFHGDTEDDDDDGGDGVDMLGSGQPITRMNPNYLYAFISLANMIKEDPLRMDEADKLYQRAYTMRFDQVDAYTNRGELLIRQNRTKEAREMFLRAKMYDEKNPDIWYNLGVTYLLESKQQEAFPLFSKALTLDPTHRRSKYNYASLLLEMQPQLQNSATQVQGGSGFVDAELQQQQMREANYRQAVRLLEQMWAEDEQRGEGRGDHKVALRLANYYIDTNNKEQAVIWHRRAAQVNPSDHQGLFNLALVLSEMKQFNESLEYVEKALQLNPKYVKAFALKGDVLAKSGRRKEAIEAFESALEIDPFHLTSGHNLCVNLFNFHQPQVPQHVLDCFEKYIRMAPPGHEIHTHYQWIRSQMKPVQT